MKKLIFLMLLSTCFLHAETKWHKAYNWSIAAVIAGNAMDATSSYGMRELNPVLGTTTFGSRQIGIKALGVGSILVTEWLIMRRRPNTEKSMAIFNYTITGVSTTLAVRNWKIK